MSRVVYKSIQDVHSMDYPDSHFTHTSPYIVHLYIHTSMPTTPSLATHTLFQHIVIASQISTSHCQALETLLRPLGQDDENADSREYANKGWIDLYQQIKTALDRY